MNRINFNKLYYFYVVAKEGSVKSASQKLHLTQPTISAQIRQLEEDLGFDVFIRKHRKLELNRNGKHILKKAEKLFTIADELITELPKNNLSDRIKLKIGAIQSLSNSFIYDFSLRLWSDETVMISVTQGSLTDLIKKMNNNELDIILSDGPYSRSKKFKSTRLGQDRIVAVANCDFVINKKKFPHNLDGLPYVSFSTQGRLQEDIDYFFQREGVHPEKVGEVDDITLMRVITENSNCFSILPLRAVRESLKAKNLKKIGDLMQIESGLWAITSSMAANRVIIKQVIQDYFLRKQ